MEINILVDFHKIVVDVIFSHKAKMPRYSQMQERKWIEIFGQQSVSSMLK